MALAGLLTWPLPRHLRTHLLSEASGDTAVYLWNLWVFRYELVEHARVPFRTGHVLAYVGGADLSLHNYAPIAGFLGLPFVESLGLVGTYNWLMLVFMALSGLGVCLLARRLGIGAPAAWSAGALFVASPVLTARQTGHFSMVIAAALPVFLWALLRTLDTGRVRDAGLVGVLVAAATYSDAYYGVYCVLMGAFVVVWQFGRAEWLGPPSGWRRLTGLLDVAIAGVAVLIAWRTWSGATGLGIGPIAISLRTLYTPGLLLTCAIALRVWLWGRPVWHVHDPSGRLPHFLRLGAVAVSTCLVLLLPLLVGVAGSLFMGELDGTGTLWRSSPRGVDALAYLVPNPSHPWFGDWTRQWFRPPNEPNWYPEMVGSFSLVAFAVIAAGWRVRALPPLWIAFTAFFALLSLGPFVHVAGNNTYVPGPWSLMRYVPLIEMARVPSRLAVVAGLGLCLLFAFGVEGLRRRFVGVRGRSACVVVLALALAWELVPSPRRLHAVSIPDVYRSAPLTGDEPGALLALPVGLHDGLSAIGRFDAARLYFQSEHKRPMVGAYLSRISRQHKEEYLRAPMLKALFELSEGRDPSEKLASEARASREDFLRRSCVRFVVINTQQASAALRAFAIDTLDLVLVTEDATHALLVPMDSPPCW